VGADGAVGEVELLADVAVGEAFGGEVSDLEFLGRQLVAGGGLDLHQEQLVLSAAIACRPMQKRLGQPGRRV
jgi:hypothetical protein